MIYLKAKLKLENNYKSKNRDSKLKKYYIYTDGSFLGILYQSDIKRLGLDDKLTTGKRTGAGDTVFEASIDELEYNQMMAVLYKRCFNRAISLSDKTEVCEKDLRFKLSNREYSNSIIDLVIEDMYEQNYINDKRYSELYVESYMKKKSISLIKKELIAKGISQNTIDLAIEDIYSIFMNESEDVVISELLDKYYKNKDLSDIKNKNRATAFLLRRGFSLSSINNHLT